MNRERSRSGASLAPWEAGGGWIVATLPTLYHRTHVLCYLQRALGEKGCRSPAVLELGVAPPLRCGALPLGGCPAARATVPPLARIPPGQGVSLFPPACRANFAAGAHGGAPPCSATPQGCCAMLRNQREAVREPRNRNSRSHSWPPPRSSRAAWTPFANMSRSLSGTHPHRPGSVLKMPNLKEMNRHMWGCGLHPHPHMCLLLSLRWPFSAAC